MNKIALMERSRLITRERIIGLFAGVVVASLAFFYVIRWLESAMTFHPARISPERAASLRPTTAEDVWVTTSDNVRLHAWFFQSKRTPATAAVIYFHGNGGNITNVGWVGEALSARGFDTLLLDYRGYGQSEGHARDETGLYADGEAAYSHIVEQRRADPARVVLYGQSLGSAVATDLASRKKCGALILESGLSSASSVASSALPWLPRVVHSLAKNRFDSAQKLRDIRVPVLITHGDPDPVLATTEAHILYGAANEPKKLLLYAGVGHNVFGSLGNRYLDVVEGFISEAFNENTNKPAADSHR